MFEITADHIALLNEDDLRTLVGLLCESEVRRHGFSSSSVTWGGNQNAADGGLDVRVSLPPNTAIEGFVPRPATGFQVKTPDMPHAEILAEMRPRGVIRQAIQELADQAGAYIIVSSTGSTSHLALQNRRAAMAEAVQDLANRAAITLDFYDRTRLASWVRDHADLIPWVRQRVGKAIQGWRSYGPWAYEPDGVKGGYLLDDTIRVQIPGQEVEGGMDALQGINRIRLPLQEPGGIVRLVGLSGTGKTRLVQALFDDRVGEHTLDSSLAIYTNLADNPDPQPTGLASDLLAARTRAVLVIDNCPPELHRRLSELCRSPDTTVSVITIEYDIREDQPEGTDVFELQPSSRDLIEKLVEHRFPTLSRIDAHTIADFSGGNARIAIALAATVEKNGTIAGLNDEELFQRLFQQRHEPNESLLRTAQACSLVYSFHGEDVSDEAELSVLGTTVGEDAAEMFRNVAELRRRDLVQQRGLWRAVLPPAIANRLAAIALQNIPFETIRHNLVNGASARLLKSFSRRLGYLHASNEATSIVRQWLGIGGLLEDVTDLNDLGRTIFENVAPAAPEESLSALERALLGPERDKALQSCACYVGLLRSLAYDAALFERCIKLILTIAEAGDVNNKANEAGNVFPSLFYICFSGTRATIEQRLVVIETLLLSGNPKKRALGSIALKAALEGWHFQPLYGFEFGARSRDYGYRPITSDDVKHWFSSTLNLAEIVACTDGPSALSVRDALAEQFRGLWSKAGMYDELERVSRTISQKQFWPKGWIAVRTIQHFDSKDFTSEVAGKLASLEELLRPRDLVQQVRSIVLFPTGRTSLDLLDLDFEDDTVNDIKDRYARMEAMAQSLGNAIAADDSAFAELLAELVTAEGRLWSFARGLVESAEDPGTMWELLAAQLAATPRDKWKTGILRGFLHALQEKSPDLANFILDNAIEDETLAPLYPVLEASAGIGKQGVTRLMRSLEIGRAPIGTYRSLAAGRVTDTISGNDFRELVLQIARKAEGLDVASNILHMRLHSEKDQQQGHSPEIISAGRELLRQLDFTTHSDREDYALGEISKSCLVAEEDATIAREICRSLKDSISKHEIHAFSHDDLLQGLFTVQPFAALDGLFDSDSMQHNLVVRIFNDFQEHRKNPFDSLTESVLLAWCDQKPRVRYPIAAAGITLFRHADQIGPREWTDVALRVFEKAPNRVEVLSQFVRRFSPSGWSGSRAAIIDANVKLLDKLEMYEDRTVINFVAEEKIRLRGVIDYERRLETASDKERDERFE